MKNLTLHSDLNNKVIEIRYGFEVDYSNNSSTKDYNNNGSWGTIVNHGEVVRSVSYDPNKCAPNFGQSDYESKFSFMKRQLEVYKALQPKQIEKHIEEQKQGR